MIIWRDRLKDRNLLSEPSVGQTDVCVYIVNDDTFEVVSKSPFEPNLKCWAADLNPQNSPAVGGI